MPARWTTLAQVHDTNAYFYRPLARGSLRPARLLRWAFDAERFPDLVDATVLVAMRVEDFTMEFPVAQVLTTTGELAQ